MEQRIFSSEVNKFIGKEIKVAGWIHKIRKLGGISFIVLRDKDGLVQAVVDQKEDNAKLSDLTTESVVSIVGEVKKEDRAPGGAEILVKNIDILSAVKEDIPVEINKKEMNVNLDTLLDNRTITLRNPRQRAIFKVQAEILRSFRNFFSESGFTEINTPKIVSAGAETGGAEMFNFKYFKKENAFLAQSPQLYKQIMVGVFERVFETAFVYRAEPHSTSRHINEYLSMDVELGFIDSWEDLMKLAEDYLKSKAKDLEKNCKEEMELLGAQHLQIPEKIPALKLTEAQEILEKEFGEKCVGEPDLDPKHEKQISEYALKKYGSDFIFITHYPAKKRPFYTMLDPGDSKVTLSFDMIFRGVELVTGGQRIHNYEMILERMKEKGVDPEGFSEYLEIFKYGMPPHGGFAFGLERFTQKLAGLDNVKEASLFPRDMNRLKP